MTARARVDAMKPKRPGPTRTAPPRPPDQFWTRGRYRGYVAFGSCGFFLVAVGLLMLRAAWALGNDDAGASWNDLRSDFENPAYVGFHAVAFMALVWFALRFFRLFPKTQPPKIGPLPRPPNLFFAALLNGGFAVASIAFALLLLGALP